MLVVCNLVPRAIGLELWEDSSDDSGDDDNDDGDGES